MKKIILVIFTFSFSSILLSQDWNHYGLLGIGKYEYSNYLTVGWGGRKFYNDTSYKKWSLKIRDFDNEGIISVGYGWGKAFNKTRYFEIIPQFDYVITDNYDGEWDSFPEDKNGFSVEFSFGFTKYKNNKSTKKTEYPIGVNMTKSFLTDGHWVASPDYEINIESEKLLKPLMFITLLWAASGGASDSYEYEPYSTNSSGKYCHVFGNIKFVDYGEDYKVKIVNYGEDLKVKYLDWGMDSSGEWKAVEYGQDYKIKIVDYGEDFKIKIVDYGQGCD